MNDNETVRDVCEEIRKFDPADDIDIPWTKLELMAFLHRIESANKLEVENVRKCLTEDCERFKIGAEPCTTCTVYSYEREVSRLNAALKPVLECEFVIGEDDVPIMTKGDALLAVREAQRIYKEGEAK